MHAGALLNESAGRHGGTALHAAVWRKRPGALEILLDAGADPTIKDFQGATPADLAILIGEKAAYKKISEKNFEKLHSNKVLTPLLKAILRMRENEHSCNDAKLAQLEAVNFKDAGTIVALQLDETVGPSEEDGIDQGLNFLLTPEDEVSADDIARIYGYNIARAHDSPNLRLVSRLKE